MKSSALMWIVLTVAVSVSMFMLKYKVQALNEELVAKKEQIERNQDAVRVLEAEWAYFNDPERLRRLSAEHLGFIQSSAVHIKTMSALPFREGLLPPQKDQKNDTALSTQSLTQDPVKERAASPQPAALTATQHLSVGPVLFARIQRYLIPTRAKATYRSGGTP